jgi:hypothetical protein
MRPHAVNESGILAPNATAVLYVKRDTMTNLWRLAWMVPGESCFCYDDGECSALLFERRRDAIAYGKHAYDEIAQEWES